MNDIPDPNQIFPNEYKTSVFLKNVITAPNIIPATNRQILPDSERHAVRHGKREPPAFERLDVSVQRVRWSMGSEHAAAPFPTAAQGRHRCRQ